MKRRLFANISHEFRTPLTLLLGPTHDALQQNRPLAPDQVKLVHRNGKRLQTLINQLLDLSALDDGGLVPDAQWYDLALLVRSTAATFTPLAERNQLTLNTHVPDKEIYVHIDENQLRTAVKNLISNAIKYTPSGGCVDVSLSMEMVSDEKRPQHIARIAVSDTGPGIPQDEQERLFDRFQRGSSTATRAQEGSGIGLSLARELVELNGGTIHIESDSGSGATFAIELEAQARRTATVAVPNAAEEARAVATGEHGLPGSAAGDVPSRSSTSANGMQGPLVLIVDDNADVRRYVRSVLESTMVLGAPCSVIEAPDGEAGLKAARTRLPDCIVSDVMMPEMDGFEMGTALMDHPMTEGIPLLYLTARASIEDEVDGLHIGADAYLVKPFERRALQARVESLIQKRLRLRALYQFSDDVPTSSGEGDEAASTPETDFAAEVLRVIRTHMRDPSFGVNELTDALAISRSHLYRRVKEELNQTPSALIREERLKQARALLHSQEGNVSEVAYAVGFNSLSHFSTVFRKQYDTSPSEVMTGSG